MLAWLAMQVMFAGSRDFAEATRALADDMLYDYARLAAARRGDGSGLCRRDAPLAVAG